MIGHLLCEQLAEQRRRLTVDSVSMLKHVCLSLPGNNPAEADTDFKELY